MVEGLACTRPSADPRTKQKMTSLLAGVILDNSPARDSIRKSSVSGNIQIRSDRRATPVLIRGSSQGRDCSRVLKNKLLCS